MATEVVTGTIKLAQRIVEDARADAEKTRASAEESMAAIRAENEKALAQRSADFAAKREAAVKSVLDGCKTRAELDGRKYTLAEKRAVIDAVFEKTYEALLTLGGDARKNVLAAMLKAEAEDGDVVVPSGKDRGAMAEIVKGFSEARITLSDEDAGFDGGFLLANNGYEKDCSFVSLLRDLRDGEETGVARLLFTSEGGQS